MVTVHWLMGSRVGVRTRASAQPVVMSLSTWLFVSLLLRRRFSGGSRAEQTCAEFDIWGFTLSRVEENGHLACNLFLVALPPFLPPR